MSSFLEKMKARMANAQTGSRTPAQKKAAVRKSKHVIRTNRWDERVWERARKTKPIDGFVKDVFEGDKREDREGYEMAPELVRDVFMSLYKTDPILEKKRDVTRESYANRKIVEEILESDELQQLQEFTAGDPMYSTIAAANMRDSIVEIITRLPEPPPPPGQGGGQGAGGAGNGAGQGQPGQGGQGGQGGQPDQGDDEGDPEGENQQGTHDEWDPDAEDNQPEADWEAMYDEMMEQAGLDMDVAQAIAGAQTEVEDLKAAQKGIGLEDGMWATMSPEERLKLADRLRSPEMKELASVIGRMRRFALGTRATRVINVPHEAYDVEQGDKIPLALKSQFALLGDPNTEMEFYRQLADRELLQFKMRGNEDAGRGPMVLAIDKSGSMSGAPFNWAMGVAEALRRFSADDNRDYYAMFFGNNNDRNRFEFPKGKGPWEKIEAFLSVAANGGTQFDGVLTEALSRAQTAFDADGKGKADIVFITDGQSYLDEEWIEKFNAERKRVGVRVYSVYIGGAYDYYGGDDANSLLNKISDTVITVKDLNPEAVEKIFASV